MGYIKIDKCKALDIIHGTCPLVLTSDLKDKELSKELKRIFNENQNEIKRNVFYVPNSMWEHIDNNFTNKKGFMNLIINEHFNASGTMMWTDDDYRFFVAYSIKSLGLEELRKEQAEGNFPSYATNAIVSDFWLINYDGVCNNFGEEIDIFGQKDDEIESREIFANCDTADKRSIYIRLIYRAMIIELFKKYADIEVVYVFNKQRKKSSTQEDSVENNSGYKIAIIDSKWFREIIRLEGFKVRGHFRLQPCKNDKGEWITKLIYIKDYEKHGYHRRALKNIAESNNGNNDE